MIVVHIAIGAATWVSDWAATIYAIATVAACAAVVLRTRRPDLVIGAVGYVAGAEVLWRMTDAHIFWETGKYATAGLVVLGSTRFWPGWRAAVLPALFLALLVPGALVAVDHFGLSDAREPISFNLAGPFAIALSVFFFSQVRIGLERFRLVLWPVVFPIVAMATAVLIGTVEAGSIHFEGESNFATSGNFAPNQVSAVLGFGALVCIVLAVIERDRATRGFEIVLAVAFFAQALLTLARGGVANVVVAGLLALLTTLGRPSRAGRIALLILAGIAVTGLVVFPVLNALSGGGLLDRYQSSSLTNRDSIGRHDLELFRQEPVLGVGTGVAQTMRPDEIRGEGAHTEYTRLLAEHGAFGIAALCVLIAMVVLAFRRARPGLSRALVAAFTGWSFTEMAHSATRIALVSYALGLAVATAGLTTGWTPRVSRGRPRS